MSTNTTQSLLLEIISRLTGLNENQIKDIINGHNSDNFDEIYGLFCKVTHHKLI